MQRMKNLLLVLGGTLDALFLKECYEKMQPHFVVAADGALEKVLAAGIQQEAVWIICSAIWNFFIFPLQKELNVK